MQHKLGKHNSSTMGRAQARSAPNDVVDALHGGSYAGLLAQQLVDGRVLAVVLAGVPGGLQQLHAVALALHGRLSEVRGVQERQVIQLVGIVDQSVAGGSRVAYRCVLKLCAIVEVDLVVPLDQHFLVVRQRAPVARAHALDAVVQLIEQSSKAVR